MNKKTYIINGSGGTGKDTWVEFISIHLNDIYKRFNTVINFSSVDKVKEIAKEIGWDGKKTEKDRKFLSDLKVLTSDYCDLPFKSMKGKYDYFMSDACESIALFLHIREPKEIARAKNKFNAETILIRRDSVGHITSNMADKNVFDYEYDYEISNDGSLEDLCNKAKEFVVNVILEGEKHIG